jgi:hypothetical protein
MHSRLKRPFSTQPTGAPASRVQSPHQNLRRQVIGYDCSPWFRGQSIPCAEHCQSRPQKEIIFPKTGGHDSHRWGIR